MLGDDIGQNGGDLLVGQFGIEGGGSKSYRVDLFHRVTPNAQVLPKLGIAGKPCLPHKFACVQQGAEVHTLPSDTVQEVRVHDKGMKTQVS